MFVAIRFTPFCQYFGPLHRSYTWYIELWCTSRESVPSITYSFFTVGCRPFIATVPVFQRWFRPPLQLHSTRRVPAALLPLGTSMHLPLMPVICPPLDTDHF